MENVTSYITIDLCVETRRLKQLIHTYVHLWLVTMYGRPHQWDGGDTGLWRDRPLHTSSDTPHSSPHCYSLTHAATYRHTVAYPAFSHGATTFSILFSLFRSHDSHGATTFDDFRLPLPGTVMFTLTFFDLSFEAWLWLSVCGFGTSRFFPPGGVGDRWIISLSFLRRLIGERRCSVCPAAFTSPVLLKLAPSTQQ